MEDLITVNVKFTDSITLLLVFFDYNQTVILDNQGPGFIKYQQRIIGKESLTHFLLFYPCAQLSTIQKLNLVPTPPSILVRPSTNIPDPPNKLI